MNFDKGAGLTKKQLRTIVLNRLKKQSEQQRIYKSKLIERKLLKQEEFIKAKRIMFYRTIDREVKTESMINKARELGKEIYVPICDTTEHTLRPCLLMKDSEWEIGPYKTWEPKAKINVSEQELDLVIVPALAFDKDGNRLGRGKGYYDRFLKTVSGRVYSIGLAFSFQIFPTLPIDQNDISVEKVLSA